MQSSRTQFFVVRRMWRPGGLSRLANTERFTLDGQRHRGAPSNVVQFADGRSLAPQWSGNHTINLRASIPLPGGRWYLTIVAGRERRNMDRLQEEGQASWLRQATAYALLTSLLLWLAVCMIAAIYLVKSALGIDLFEGHSPFHFLWEWLHER